MDSSGLDARTAERFETYLDTIGATLRDKRQRASFATYAAGLLADGSRKSMEPIAARASTDPALTSAIHHRLIHFLGSAAWKDAPVRTAAARDAVDELERHGPISTWIVDDTGFLKQGKRSPGVQRQYTGSAGKRANCQIGVSLVLANERAEVPVDFKLYIPQSWADDRKRCRAPTRVEVQGSHLARRHEGSAPRPCASDASRHRRQSISEAIQADVVAHRMARE